MKKLAELISHQHNLAKLASDTGIDERRLKELSAGGDPTMAEVRALATSLKVAPAELLSTNKEEQIGLLFRETAARSDLGTVSRLSNKITWSLDLLPERDVAGPWWLGQFSRSAHDFKAAEDNANRFRCLFFADNQMSPFLHLPSLAANTLGILVFILRLKGIDGASAIYSGVPFVFLAEQFRPRMLFTLAHEIGHLIAHHDPGTSFAVVDLLAERPRKRKNALESYAHAFASSLLMPPRGVAIALERIRAIGKRNGEPLGDIELLFLARIFGVSFYAAARRCEDLDLLPRGGAASLDHALRKKFESPEKRAEELGLPARPEIEFPRLPEPLLASAIERIRAGEISIGRASEVLGFSISDLIEANASVIQ
jgi:Zn-dependent peptidase ImmA (M78 family)